MLYFNFTFATGKKVIMADSFFTRCLNKTIIRKRAARKLLDEKIDVILKYISQHDQNEEIAELEIVVKLASGICISTETLSTYGDILDIFDTELLSLIEEFPPIAKEHIIEYTRMFKSYVDIEMEKRKNKTDKAGEFY